MFKLNLLEGLKNINKNKFSTFLSVIIFAFLFMLQGHTYSYYTVSEMRKERAEYESMKDYQIYVLGCIGGPSRAWAQCPEDSKIESAEFFEDLDNAEHLKYVVLGFGGIQIEDFKGDPETFVYYERENEPDSVYALYVSPSFHQTETLRVIEGRYFTDEDTVFVEGKPRAVLLGYKYKGIYEVGDILQWPCDGNYQDSYYFPGLEVIGILEEDTTVSDRAGVIYDLDNYIVYPRFFIPLSEKDNVDENIIRYLAMNYSKTYTSGIKVYIDKEFEAEGKAELQEAINGLGTMSKFYMILDKKQSLQKTSARTEAITQFAFGITVVLMFFSIFTILSAVISRIKNNLKDYSIHLSIGASLNSIICFVISEMTVILTCSVTLGLILTKWLMAELYMPYYFLEFLGIFAVTSLFVILLSAITAKLALKKYDLCTLIK